MIWFVMISFLLIELMNDNSNDNYIPDKAVLIHNVWGCWDLALLREALNILPEHFRHSAKSRAEKHKAGCEPIEKLETQIVDLYWGFFSGFEKGSKSQKKSEIVDHLHLWDDHRWLSYFLSSQQEWDTFHFISTIVSSFKKVNFPDLYLVQVKCKRHK